MFFTVTVRVRVRVSVNPNPNLACEQALRGALEAGREKEGELVTTSLDFHPNSTFNSSVACSRLRDGGGKSFSNKKCEKHAAIFPGAIAPFPKSCPSYFRFARFNTFPLYYLRAWHRLILLWLAVD